MSAKAALTLRPLQESDASRIFELIGDWEVARWLSSPPYPYVLHDAEEFLAVAIAQHEEGVSRTEAIVVHERLAGIIGIEHTSRGLNLGYWLGRPFWGQGIMTRATTMLTRDFFAKPGDTPLISGYFSANEASRAIQRRLGFEFVEDGNLFNRPHGKPMPHVFTRLSRARYEGLCVAT
jgi:RimJ/RimL family protein N-acetyltransferase